jgi:transposase
MANAAEDGDAGIAQAVLRCAGGVTNTQVAEELQVTNATVGKWRSRVIARGLAGLLDDPRSGAPSPRRTRSGGGSSGGHTMVIP